MARLLLPVFSLSSQKITIGRADATSRVTAEFRIEKFLIMLRSSTPPSSSQSADTGTPRIHYLFLVIYLAGLSAFGSFVNDMYIPSLPSMKEFFHCSVPTVQLGLTMGMIGLGLGEIVLGPISDKYGRKPVLIATLIIFIAAAVVSVFSPTIEFFLCCRLAQGLGASGGYFLARTIPADFYAGRMLARTMAIVGAINGIAPASAPVLGGFISDSFTWRGVFWALAIIAVILLVFTPRLMESLPKERRSQSSLLRTFGNYGQLLRNRPFMIHVMLKASALGFLFAYISSAPFIMQTHFHFSQTVFGCIIGANALFVAVGAMLALRFRILKRAALAGGIGLAVAVATETVLMTTVDSFWAYELPLLPILFCLGMIFTVSNTLAMNEGRRDAGGASALLGMAGYVVGAIVSPLVGLGDILHSTAIVFAVVAVMVLVSAYMSARLPADLDRDPAAPSASND